LPQPSAKLHVFLRLGSSLGVAIFRHFWNKKSHSKNAIQYSLALWEIETT
jgi:hypothetical protein